MHLLAQRTTRTRNTSFRPCYLYLEPRILDFHLENTVIEKIVTLGNVLLSLTGLFTASFDIYLK